MTTIDLSNLQMAVGSVQTSLDDQGMEITGLGTCLEDHKANTLANFATLLSAVGSVQTSLDDRGMEIAGLETCLEDHKANTLANFTTLLSAVGSVQTSLNDRGMEIAGLETCLEDHKANTLANFTTLLSAVESVQTSLDDRGMEIAGLETCLEDHKANTLANFTTLLSAVGSVQTSLGAQGMEIAGLETCLKDHKANTLTNFTTLLSAVGSVQITLAGLEICLEDHKTNTSSQLDAVETLQHPCGGPGWTQVVNFDMAIANTECPEGWELGEHSKRSCGRTNDGANTCSIANFIFEEGPQQFSKVCGHIKAYAAGGPDAFESATTETSIDSAFVSGVALTTGISPKIEHIWTFAAGIAEVQGGSTSGNDLCPCDDPDSIPPPLFVDNKYFCESAVNIPFNFGVHNIFHSSDPLWDGENCNDDSNCCEFNRPPYFVNDLGKSLTASSIDARLCLHNRKSTTVQEDILVEVVEIYIAT